jgi:hypothetical protein
MLRQFKICSGNAISVNCNRLIEDKQDEIAELRINNEEIRIEHLQWDIGNIEYVLAFGKQSSIPKDAKVEFGVFARRSKEHWEKMSEYSKETQKMYEAFEKGLPSWLGGHDESWLDRCRKRVKKEKNKRSPSSRGHLGR